MEVIPFFYQSSGVLNTKKVAKKNGHSIQRLLLFGSQDFEYQRCYVVFL
jgi:hypothetical protein